VNVSEICGSGLVGSGITKPQSSSLGATPFAGLVPGRLHAILRHSLQLLRSIQLTISLDVT
jgi:hypothetical protein